MAFQLWLQAAVPPEGALPAAAWHPAEQWLALGPAGQQPWLDRAGEGLL